MIRIGFGFDTHRLQSGGEFWLGGVLIPHDKGAVGHSDADVLIHAIIDALLGAAGLRDIGTQFPDTAAEYKGIDSKVLLSRTMAMVTEKGFATGNLDVTIVLEKPKVSSHVPEIISTLATILSINPDQISVKAKTSEKMGFIGREEGVSAYAVVLLESIKNDN